MRHVIVPLIGIAIAVAVPLTRYAQKIQAESAAAEFLMRVHEAQQVFRNASSARGYATDIASLTTACRPGDTAEGQPTVHGPQSTVHPERLDRIGYTAQLRAAADATFLGEDCHGRPLASDYYAAAEPISSDTAGQQAFALTSAGRIFVFFDGVAPREHDMAAGGLATQLDELGQFKIP